MKGKVPRALILVFGVVAVMCISPIGSVNEVCSYGLSSRKKDPKTIKDTQGTPLL